MKESLSSIVWENITSYIPPEPYVEFQVTDEHKKYCKTCACEETFNVYVPFRQVKDLIKTCIISSMCCDNDMRTGDQEEELGDYIVSIGGGGGMNYFPDPVYVHLGDGYGAADLDVAFGKALEEIRALEPSLTDPGLRKMGSEGFIMHRFRMILTHTSPAGSSLLIPRGICPRQVDWRKDGVESEREKECREYAEH